MMSQQSRRELIGVVAPRYQQAQVTAREQILKEFVGSHGYHRKYATQVLNHPPQPFAQRIKRFRKRHYSLAVQKALLVCWRASDGICSKRLVPYLPELACVLERQGELRLNEATKTQLLTVSPATVDRLLQKELERFARRGLGTRHSRIVAQRVYSQLVLCRLG